MRFARDLLERHTGGTLPVAEPLPKQLPKRTAQRVARCVPKRLPEQLPKRIAEREAVRTADPVAITAAVPATTGQPIAWADTYLVALGDSGEPRVHISRSSIVLE